MVKISTHSQRSNYSTTPKAFHIPPLHYLIKNTKNYIIFNKPAFCCAKIAAKTLLKAAYLDDRAPINFLIRSFVTLYGAEISVPTMPLLGLHQQLLTMLQLYHGIPREENSH